MSAISSVSAHATAVHRAAAPKIASIKANDGDSDDVSKTAAPTKLATSGPGQLISKLA